MKKKSCHIISTNRADLSLLYKIMQRVTKLPNLNVKNIFLGEISGEREYVEKKFKISNKVFLGKSIKYGKINNLINQAFNFARYYSEYLEKNIKPDFVICLGDRYELLSIAQVLTLYRVPIIHIHGGDITYGALDNDIRFSISKLAKLHCVVSRNALKNLRFVGEERWRISCVGSPGRELLKDYRKKITRNKLFNYLGINSKIKIAFVAYHSETADGKYLSFSKTILKSLIDNNLFPVVTRPNHDPYSDLIRKELKDYSNKNYIKLLNKSVGPKYMAALMEHSDIMIGNSSSGILEASLFNLPVINVGKRQNGRDHDKNVISIPNKYKNINDLVKKYRGKKINIKKSIYDFGNASEKVVEHIVKNLSKLGKEKAMNLKKSI